ncbi:MAG: hypothetical protein MMC33_002108 [Icmadophila ericetorum]|nr:hypothetical protein [Icmadophila ericetorum]
MWNAEQCVETWLEYADLNIFMKLQIQKHGSQFDTVGFWLSMLDTAPEFVAIPPKSLKAHYSDTPPGNFLLYLTIPPLLSPFMVRIENLPDLFQNIKAAAITSQPVRIPKTTTKLKLKPESTTPVPFSRTKRWYPQKCAPNSSTRPYTYLTSPRSYDRQVGDLRMHAILDLEVVNPMV